MPTKNYEEGIGMTKEEIEKHNRFTNNLRNTLECIAIGAILTSGALYIIKGLTTKTQELSPKLYDFYTQIQQYFNNMIS